VFEYDEDKQSPQSKEGTQSHTHQPQVRNLKQHRTPQKSSRLWMTYVYAGW